MGKVSDVDEVAPAASTSLSALCAQWGISPDEMAKLLASLQRARPPVAREDARLARRAPKLLEAITGIQPGFKRVDYAMGTRQLTTAALATVFKGDLDELDRARVAILNARAARPRKAPVKARRRRLALVLTGRRTIKAHARTVNR